MSAAEQRPAAGELKLDEEASSCFGNLNAGTSTKLPPLSIGEEIGPAESHQNEQSAGAEWRVSSGVEDERQPLMRDPIGFGVSLKPSDDTTRATRRQHGEEQMSDRSEDADAVEASTSTDVLSSSKQHLEYWMQDTFADNQAELGQTILAGLSPKAASAQPLNLLKRSEGVVDLKGRAQVRKNDSLSRIRQAKVSLTSRSLYLFEPDNKFRILCYRLISSQYFEWLVMFVILINCITLALYIPNKPDHILTKISHYGEYAVTSLFTMEFLIKITALGGFLHEGAYLGYWPDGDVDWWNLMDLFVILLGFISLIPGSNNFQALRTLRLLRPLASISTSTSMRVLLKALYGSLARLVDVLILCSFLYLLYGIVGVQIWMGTFRNHCVHVVTGDILDVDVVCGSCPSNYTCRDTMLDNVTALPNPNHGVNSFDHFGYASVVVFQTLFSEGWVQIESYTQAISGNWCRIYWVSLIILGCFFAVNLAIGVVFASFTRVTELERRDALRKKARQEAEDNPYASEAARAGDTGFLARRHWKKANRIMHLAMNNGRARQEHFDQEGGDPLIINGRDSDWKVQQVSASECSEGMLGMEEECSDAIHPLPAEGDNGTGIPPVRFPPNMPGYINEGRPDSQRTPRTARDVVIQVNKRAEEAQQSVSDSRPVAEGFQVQRQAEGITIRKCSGRADTCHFTCQIEHHKADALQWSEAPVAIGESRETEFDMESDDLKGPSSTYPCLCCCETGINLKSRIRQVAISPELQGLIALCIVGNMVVLSLVHYPMSESFASALQISNSVFLSVFTLEAVVKIAGLGFREYFKDSFNIFDFCIVLLSWGEIAIDVLTAVEFPGLTVLRATRLLRILKVFNQWSSLSNLAIVILKGISNLMSFLIILFIFIFTSALIGMQMFSGRMCAEYGCTDPSVSAVGECIGSFIDDSGKDAVRNWECAVYLAEPATYNYDDAWQAFLCTFQIFTGENWHMIMYAAVSGTNMASCLYFITVVVFGHYLLLNLFLAGIVRNVVDQHTKQREKERKQALKNRLSNSSGNMMKRLESGRRHARNSFNRFSFLQRSSSLNSLSNVGNLEAEANQQAPGFLADGHADSVSQRRIEKMKSFGLLERSSTSFSYVSDNGDGDSDDSDPDLHVFRRLVSIWPSRTSRRSSSTGSCFNEESQQYREQYSLYLFSVDNSFRQWCYKLVTHTYFDIGIVVLIFLSSVLLALQNPHRPFEGMVHEFLNALDHFFTALFVMEALLKIIAFGFLWPESGPLGKAYLRDSWNILDFLIVILSIVSEFFQSKLKAFKTIRTTRAIRPLRILSKSDGMKQVLRSLSRVVAESGSIFVCMLLAWLIFAVLGVELFSGKFYCCSDPSRIYQEGMAVSYGGDLALECSGNFTDPISGQQVPREWQSSLPNFDNTGQALLTLFEITTLEDWDAVMQKAIDSRGIGICPKRNSNPVNAVYFLAFIIFGALYMFNLVVSAVINEYIRSKDYGGFDAGALSFKEIEWVDTIKTWLSTRPEKLYRIQSNAGPLRKWLFMIVHHHNMEIFILGCVCANTILMMCDHWGASQAYWTITEYINYCFGGIYFFEAVLKIIGMGYREYFSDRWNHLDFAIVVLWVVTTAVTQLGHSVYLEPSLIRVFRMFRAARILRAARRAKGMRMLIRTLRLSLSSLWHVGSVLFLVFLIFSILGVYLLGDAERGGMINDEINFETFGNSLWVLFFILTGENWPTLLHDLINQGKMEAIPFFLVFISMAFFILLNLFLAVILDRFTETKRMEDYKLSQADFTGFSKAWAELDPDASLFIPAVRLEGLVERLPLPLGIEGMGFTSIERLRMLQSLNLHGYGKENVVHYHEVLFALSYRVAGCPLPEDVEKVIINLCARAFPNLLQLPKERVSYSHTSSATRIQALARGHLARKRLKSLAKEALEASHRSATQ